MQTKRTEHVQRYRFIRIWNFLTRPAKKLSYWIVVRAGGDQFFVNQCNQQSVTLHREWCSKIIIIYTGQYNNYRITPQLSCAVCRSIAIRRIAWIVNFSRIRNQSLKNESISYWQVQSISTVHIILRTTTHTDSVTVKAIRIGDRVNWLSRLLNAMYFTVCTVVHRRHVPDSLLFVFVYTVPANVRSAPQRQPSIALKDEEHDWLSVSSCGDSKWPNSQGTNS